MAPCRFSILKLLALSVLLFTLVNCASTPKKVNVQDKAAAKAAAFFSTAEDDMHPVPDDASQDIDMNELGRFVDSTSERSFRHVASSLSRYWFLITLFDTFAYGHLLYLTSKSRSYTVELIQLVSFACFPALPTIQLFNNAMKAITAIIMGTASGALYTVSSICGQHVFYPHEKFKTWNARSRLVEVPFTEVKSYTKQRLSSSWVSRLVVIVITVATGILSVLVHRYEEHPTFSLAAIGMDQRQGLMAMGGALSAFLALGIHACHTSWTIKPKTAAQDEPVTLLWESEVFTEIVMAAILQDSMIGIAGGRSFTGKIAIFMANRFILATLFIAVILFNRYIKLAASWVMGPSKRSTTLRPLAIIFSLSLCASIALLQVFTTLREFQETASQGLT